MKKIFTILILAFFISSCSKNEYEQKLIGNWNNYPSGEFTDITFYEDSVVAYEYYLKRKGTWKADKSEIKLHFPKKIKGYREYYFLDYKLNNDSLQIKNKNDKEFVIPTLFKVSDYWKHYLRKIDLQIELPKADFKLIKNDSMNLGINLYIGYKNEKLSIKSDSRNFNQKSDLMNLAPLVFSEKAMREKSEDKFMYFNLIIDKNVSNKKIDSIKQILKLFPEMRHFRVYKNDSANYGKYNIKNNGKSWNWFGRYE